MKLLEVTRLSSKGQVVLPQAIRDKLHLIKGEKFLILGEKDTIIMKRIEMPSLIKAKKLLQLSQTYAKRVGLKKSDIDEGVRSIRSQSK